MRCSGRACWGSLSMQPLNRICATASTLWAGAEALHAHACKHTRSPSAHDHAMPCYPARALTSASALPRGDAQARAGPCGVAAPLPPRTTSAPADVCLRLGLWPPAGECAVQGWVAGAGDAAAPGPGACTSARADCGGAQAAAASCAAGRAPPCGAGQARPGPGRCGNGGQPRGGPASGPGAPPASALARPARAPAAERGVSRTVTSGARSAARLQGLRVGLGYCCAVATQHGSVRHLQGFPWCWDQRLTVARGGQGCT